MAELAATPPPQVVPDDPEARQRIRAHLRQWARRERLCPPIALEELRTLALRATADLDLPGAYLDFVTVLLGNATWEPALAAVPPEQRLLLLPQCLKSAETCQAPIDELGLLCLGCGACPIATLEAEAESLGTHVLIAEGTTVAKRLIEGGQVHGVVAVACLHSLERSFSAAAASGVPAVAIPLLDSGCRSTHVDVDWVREALHTRGTGPRFWSFRLDRLRQTVQGWFEPQALASLLCREETATEALACRAVSCGGKRWRPTLTAAVRQALKASDAEPPDPVRRIAVAVECFHKASLVHDDIEDGDLERNGQAALHVSHGTAIALNVGDLLIGEGYRLIAEAGFAPEATAQMLATVACAQRELCLGQGEELAWQRRPRSLSRSEALALLRRKTAPAFEVGLLLGARAADADEETCRALRALSTSLGLAYQVRDDIDDRAGRGAPPSPLFVALAGERYGSAFAERLLAGDVAGAEGAESLATLQHEAWSLVDRFRSESLRALQPITSQPLKTLLFRLVHLFLDRRSGGAQPGGVG